MPLALLRSLDRWIGILLLYLTAWPLRIVTKLLPASTDARARHIFVKLKGGGSLIVAMPALLGLRRQNPNAEWILVCTTEAKIYADLTGLFDRLAVIDDAGILSLILSGWSALRVGFRAALCVDLEPNSLLAAVFTILTCAKRRAGLVKPEQPVRAEAYTDSISFNPNAPIYIYYDQLCHILGAAPASAEQCRAAMLAVLPPAPLDKTSPRLIALAPFTSDFARERMMPDATWAALLRQAYGDAPPRLAVFGAARDHAAARDLITLLQAALPTIGIDNLCGAYTLAQSVAALGQCDEVWAVDSGLLHVVRLLGIPNRSFWGPTMPSQRLRPIAGLTEHVRYREFICSPCIQSAGRPPCGGNNLCMITMAEQHPDLRPEWARHQ